MSNLPPVYQRLITAGNSSVEDMLLESLDALENTYKNHAIDVLLNRQQPQALQTLIETFERLPEPCRVRLIQQIHLMESALRDSIRSTQEHTRLNTIDIIQRGQAYTMSYLLYVGLCSSSATTRSSAAAALLELAATLVEEMKIAKQISRLPGVTSGYNQKLSHLEANRDLLVSTLREAIQSYESHSSAVLIDAALTLSLNLEKELLNELRKPQSKCRTAVLDRLANDPQPFLAAFALQSLKSQNIGPQVAKIISTCRHHDFMMALMRQAWLLGDPKINAGCQAISRLDWLESSNEPLFNMNAAELTQTIRFVNATLVSEELKIQWCRTIVLSDQEDKHQAALWGLINIKSNASSDVLRVLLDWADPDLARIARHELIHRQHEEATDLPARHLERSEEEAAGEGDAVARYSDFTQYWSDFDDLDEKLRVLYGRRLIQTNPNMIDSVSTHLKSTLAADRARAIQIARTLHLVSQMKERIFDCTRHPDHIVRSAAIKALAQLGGGMAERILIVALDDPDRRVRSNAIEVLDSLKSHNRAEQLRPKLEDPDSRVRSTAIHALLKLRSRDAAESLVDLMQDPSRAHRASALWVVEKLNLSSILKRVSQMAQDDPDEGVRRKARRLLREKKQRLRQQDVPIPPPQEEPKV